jgi:hypothetical protein
VSSTQAEQNSGTHPNVQSLVIDGVYFTGVTLTISASGGTATPETDYVYTGTTVTIPAGIYNNTSIPFTGASIIGDTTYESDETISLALSASVTGVTLTTVAHTLTITNDEALIIGGGGGSSSSSSSSSSAAPSIVTPVTPAVTSGSMTPIVVKVTPPSAPLASGAPVFFTNFTPSCGNEVENLDDARLVAYYKSVLHATPGKDVHRKITRAEFLELVLLSIDADVSNETELPYTDMTMSHPKAKYIAYATRLGIVSGKNGKFRPDDQISRAEAAKILVLGTGVGLSDVIVTFSDVGQDLSLSKYIQTAYDSCILHGRRTLDGESVLSSQKRVFEPFDGITYAETAKVLYNINAKRK